MKYGFMGRLFSAMFGKTVYEYTSKAIPQMDIRGFKKLLLIADMRLGRLQTKSGRWVSKSYRLCWICKHLANMTPLFQAVSGGKMQTQTNSKSPAILVPQGFDDLRRTPRHTPNKNS